MNISLKMCERKHTFYIFNSLHMNYPDKTLHYSFDQYYPTTRITLKQVKQIFMKFVIKHSGWVLPAHWWGCPAASDRPGRTCDRSRVSGGVSLPGYTHCSRWCNPVYGCPWSSVLQSPHHPRQEPRTQAHPYLRSYRMSSIWYKHLFVFAWDV